MAGMAVYPQGMYSPAGPADPPGYGRAKERIGSETGAAIKTLREQMGGQIGSGLYTRRLRDIVMGGQSELGDVNSQMAEKEADRAHSDQQAKLDRQMQAAQAGLQAAMTVQDRPNHFGIMGHERDDAINQAIAQLRALTGYSGSGMMASYGGG